MPGLVLGNLAPLAFSRRFLRNRQLAICFFSVLLGAGASAQVTVNVDATANQHPISPYIYGVAFGSPAQLSDLNAPLNRWGGNSTTRYNWQTNSHNTAADYYYESIGSGTPSQDADNFISDAKSSGAQPMMTIPIIDWIAKAGPGHPYPCSYPKTKFPSQQSFDFWDPNCGNGLTPAGQPIPGADPNDANVPNNTTIQTQWVQHITGRFGTAGQGGLQYYILDNEHSIWQGTHRDVHPVGPNMDEIYQKMRDYSLAVKSVDSGAVVSGPEEWGWEGYFFSGYDQQYAPSHGWTYPDRAAHGNEDYLPWLLDQFHQYETTNGKRLLDVFSVHYYPQGDLSGHHEFSNDDSTATQLLRNRSTRSLWDPAYVDQSWIQQTGINGGIVRLIPLMKQWVTQHYPGLKTAVTEYNWGDEPNMNGATTQADIYGIFGREGLDIGARWTTPDASTPTYKAMKMYRNYDGSKSTFGDTSVQTTVPNPDHLSAFSALRSDGALTVMLVNKDAGVSPQVTVNLAHFQTSGLAHVWQLASNTIGHLTDITFLGNTINVTVPAQSLTLLVVGPANDFAESVSNPIQVALPGGTATFNGTLTSANGYASSVTISCGPGAPATCSQTTVTPSTGGRAFSISASNPTTGDFTFNLVATGSDPHTITHQQPVTLHVVIASADLEATLAVVPPTRAMIGTPLTYTAGVINHGPASTAATVTLTLPPNAHIMAEDPACTGISPVVCTSPTLANGASASFALTVLASLPYIFNATVTVNSSTAADPNPTNNTATGSVKVYMRPFRHAVGVGAP